MNGGWGPWRAMKRLLRRDPAAEVEEELRYHLEQRERDYVERGMDPEEARRAALERLGDLERVKRECARLLDAERRVERRNTMVRVSWLDVKLGLRMLVKYPGVSLVSVLGMAVAVAIGAGAFGSIHAMMNVALPFHEGDAVVAIETADVRDYGRPNRQVLHDFLSWRDELGSVGELAAFRDRTHNLIAADGRTELVRVAEITPSGLGLPRVPPVLGRPLLEEDARPGAAPVVVIGYDEWQRRFQGDPAVLGRPLRLGTGVHTVVGVMPEGFRFPVNHRFWTPLALNAADYERGAGPSIHVFGRLAEGVTLEEAQTELTAVGLRTAAAYPDTHEHLRPRIIPYPLAFGVDIDSPQQAATFRAIPLVVGLLLILVSVNVAILVYARTATRLGEIAVRSALGASRTRIVVQLFVEALVLAVVAAAAGLALAGAGLEQAEAWMRRISPDRIPFWWDFGISPGLAAYVAGLTIVAGVIVGVLPGLEATGRRIQGGLQQASARGSQMRLGRTWTALVVAQVAVAVGVLPFAVFLASRAVERASAEPGYAAERFLRARLAIEAPTNPGAVEEAAASPGRFAEHAVELIRRLEEEPAVSGVTFASHFPGGGRYVRVEVEGAGTHEAQVARVDTDFFGVVDVPVLTGRAFTEGDRQEGSTAVVVDRLFVERALGGGAALGRRVRYLDGSPGSEPEAFEGGPWLEIVGVVPDFTGPIGFESARPQLYQPMGLTEASRAILAVRTRSADASPFAGRLREVAAAVDPGLQVQELRTAAAHQGFGTQAMRFVGFVTGAVTLSVLLLSAAGIYAMMSFTVARRRREIGIRSALGAGPRRVLGGVFARAGTQLGVGVLTGLALAITVDRALGGELLTGRGMMLLPAVATLMTTVGLLAALGPARRGLAVEPTEALREE